MKPDFKKEKELWALGYNRVCGIDEAGRGALAGPLVAAGVILPPKIKCQFNDSKLIEADKRRVLFEKIKEISLAFAVGIASVEEINTFGIQPATYIAYKRAYTSIKLEPSFILVDHYRIPTCKIPQCAITFGDRLSQSIAAASIVAKVTRDEIMISLHKEFPNYHLKQHKGYGTTKHFKQIEKYGLSKIHRKSFIDKRHTNQLDFI